MKKRSGIIRLSEVVFILFAVAIFVIFLVPFFQGYGTGVVQTEVKNEGVSLDSFRGTK